MPYLLFLGLSLLFIAAHANDSHTIPAEKNASGDVQPIEFSLSETAVINRFYERPEWLALLHYQKQGIRTYLTSEADTSVFFLAEEGHLSPVAEIQANIEAMFATNNMPENDSDPRCLFPARFTWLSQVLQIPMPDNFFEHCTAYHAWRSKFKASSITLVFPAAYMNSPSSMYGHLFLRFDQPDDPKASTTKENQLLAATGNFAAQTTQEDEGSMLYSIRGLAGGFPGKVTVQPYYEKVIEYNDIENRDIWEYRLNFTTEEAEQVIRHIWELSSTEFDYYFLDENCAYRIAAMLDVARNQKRVAPDFTHWAIPVDIVKAIVENDTVKQSVYRPSAATDLKHKLAQLNTQERDIVHYFGYHGYQPKYNHFDSLDDQAQSRILEVAYDYIRFRALDEKLPREAYAKQAFSLIKARSTLQQTSEFAKTPQAAPPEAGHDSFKMGVHAGRYADKNFVELQARFSYHTSDDPMFGYAPGAAIEFGNLYLRAYEDELEVEKFDIITLESKATRDQFFSPLSWSITAGFHRRQLPEYRRLVPHFDGGAGLTYGAGTFRFYAMGHGYVEVSKHLPNGFDLGAQARLGTQYHQRRHQGKLEWLSQLSLSDKDLHHHQIHFRQAYNIQETYQLFVDINRHWYDFASFNELKLGFSYYMQPY